MKLLFLILLVSLLLHSFDTSAQEYATSSKKAIGLYEQAMAKMDSRDFLRAVELLESALKDDSTFTQAWLLLADANDYMGNKEKVIYSCKKAISNGGENYAIAYYFLSYAQFNLGKYKEALESANIFLKKEGVSARQKEDIGKLIANAEFAVYAIQHPVPFEPLDLGTGVNSKYDEYWPTISADGELLVFTRSMPKNPNNPEVFRNRQEDIYYSMYNEEKWKNAESIGFPVNTPDNEGASFITADGMQMYFTACNRPEGKGKCDIYYCELEDKGWSVPINLGAPVNSAYSEKQPSLTPDGQTIYFTSDRPGGKGDLDIWVATRSESGKWLEPVNLSDSINTTGREQSPFIHPDNNSIYFASDGHIGMGGFDVYVSRKESVEWSKPHNLGYPINTYADEIGLIVDARGEHAFFSSDRISDKGRDIYSFILPQDARPLAVSYLKGKIFDAETLKPLQAKFELIDLETSKIVTSSKSNKFSGDFLLCLPVNRDYALNVSKNNYLFYSENITLGTAYEKSRPMIKDIALQQIKAGKTVVLKNIFFDTNSFKLRKESEAELKKLINFLQSNSGLKIEISGHTDNVGSELINAKLSENRAKAVVEYLVKNGIDTSRLVFKGYGAKNPVAENNTEAGRARNRRTEFKIMP